MRGRRLTKNDRYFAIMRKSGGRCWYCGARMYPWQEGWPKPSVDHFISMRDGGTNDAENLVPACVPCNSSKCSRGLDDMRHNAAQRATGMPNFSRDQISYLRAKGFDLKKYDEFKFWFESHKTRHTIQRTALNVDDKTIA